MAEKCTRQLPPVRVPESLEVVLTRLASTHLVMQQLCAQLMNRASNEGHSNA